MSIVDLPVTTEKAERPEAIEEKKSAERREQQQVGASAWIHSLSHLPLAGAQTASFVSASRTTIDQPLTTG